MKGLLLKDYFGIKKDLKISYGISIIFLLLISWLISLIDTVDNQGKITMLSCYAIFSYSLLAVVLSISTFFHDEKSGYMDNIFSTPIGRRKYVRSKYALFIILGTFGSLCGTLISGAAILFFSHASAKKLIVTMLCIFVGGLILAIIVSSWLIPVFVRFKYTHAMQITILLVIAFIVATIVTIAVFSSEDTISLGILPVVFLALTAFMHCMSYVWVKKREEYDLLSHKLIRNASNTNSALMMLFIMLILTTILSEPLASLFVSKNSENFEYVSILISFILQYFIAVSIPVLLFRLTKDGKELARTKPLFSKPKMSWGWIAKHIVISLFMVYSVSYISNLFFTLIQNAADIEFYSVDFTADDNIISKITNIIAMMFLAPFFEELFFRGTLLRNASRYGKWSAIIATGIFFGLWHMNYEQTFYTACFGICAGFLMVKTESIIPSMILHFIMNTIGAVQSIALPGIDTEKLSTDKTYIMEHIGSFAITAVSGLIVISLIITGLVLFIIELCKHRDSYKFSVDKLENEPSETKRLGIYFTAPLTIIAAILYVGVTVLMATIE